MPSTPSPSSAALSSISTLRPEQRDAASVVLGRAGALRSALRKDQDAADVRGTYSPQIHAEMIAAGMYDITTPTAFGGMQLPLSVLAATIVEVATGNPGSGWCFALAAQHTTTVAAHWPMDVQEEVFTTGPFLAPHQFARPGDVRAVEGGYLVDGVYPFCSGAPYSTHILITAAVRDSIERVTILAPRADYEVLDDWGGAMGMKASGSNAVRFDGVFVDRAHTIQGIGEDELDVLPSGAIAHGDPLYLGRLSAYHPTGLAAVAVGTARAALEEFEAMLRPASSRNAAGIPRSADPLFQQTLGRATADADAAEALVYSAADAYGAAARRQFTAGDALTTAELARIAGLATSAMQLCVRSVEAVFEHVGTMRIGDGSRMQRYFRDISMLRTHGRYHPAVVAVERGQAVLGASGS